MEIVFIWRIYKILYGHINLSLTFGYDPKSSCWDNPLLIFWGRLPLEVVFFWRIYKIWFGHISLNLKFECDLISGCWDNLRSSSIGSRLHLKDLQNMVWSSKHLKFDYDPISGYWDFPLMIFWGCLPFEVIFILRICTI